MSMTMAIIMLVCMWLSVAAAMLWGVLRIARRHAHPHVQPKAAAKPRPVVPARRPAGAH
ncbi:hypothetical protein IAE33_000791 [Pseudomonas sp. S60]|uniref:hypothetical protein n=1 Tax=Pseudomonas sp. S60 TaxID=211124 RepID=UPI0019134252|nr:hypothetical protein [Pseudomonas sp. S60]MBK5008931.1 hypothetical protein [Pseudomonas sp. S60]